MRKPVYAICEKTKGADQRAHPRILISAFVIRCLDSIIPLLAITEISRPLLVSSAEQAGLGLNWSQTLTTGFRLSWLIDGLRTS